MKSIQILFIFFFLISCKDDINSKKYRNSNYVYYISNESKGEWRLINDNAENNYKKGDEIYYFFDNGDKYGNIIIIDEYSNRIEFFYNNDTIVEEIRYKNDQEFEKLKKDGFHVEYVSNKGEVLAEGLIKNNKEMGLWKDFYENGNLLREMNFKNGLRNGSFTEYYENGKISLKGKYWNGRKTDTLTWYYENGSIKQKEIYVVDTIKVICVGHAKYYFMNGKEHKSIPIINWQREGIAKIYYENGNLQYMTEYKNDKMDGIAKGFYENGKINYSGSAKDSLKDGRFNYFDEKGELINSEFYRNGKLMNN
jgi:antitoxin component YwqK of YwqJK toxin-antitoxin module